MQSVQIPFGEWLPDQPPTGLKGLVTATNVIPDVNSYLPFPILTTFSTALPARCIGGIIASDAASNNYNYFGTGSGLYSLNGTSYSAVTRAVGGAYTTATDDYWEFAQWGNTIIGCNGYTDAVQQISLGGATFTDLGSGFKAKHIAAMRDFIVTGNISDSAANSYRVRWCAINNPTSWTPDAATLADFQDLPSEGGPVQKVLGGEYGVVLQQKGVWRMLFVGSPLVFQFDRIHAQIGAYAPQAACRYQNMTFFLAADGFYSFDGSQLEPIGKGKVDRFFLADVSTTYLQRTHAYVDTSNKLVMWAYPSASTVGGNPDKLLLYNWAFKRWALVTGLNIELLVSSITTGVTLEQLDAYSSSIDLLGITLDSLQWTGGQFMMAAFDSTHKLTRFNGSAMPATLETGEFQLFPDHRAMIEEVRPTAIGLSASISISVINRNNLTESASVGGTQAYPNSTGFVQFRVDARYHRIRLQTATSVQFQHLVGCEVAGVPTGKR